MGRIEGHLRFRDVDCPVCRIAVDGPSFWATDRLYGLGGRFRYVQCGRCGLLFMNPQVAPEDIGLLYPDNYGPHLGAAGTPPEGPPSHLGRIKRWLQNARLDSEVEAALGPTSRVLDVGCGAGDFLNTVRQRTGAQVQGLDLSPNAAIRAREQYGISVECGPIESAPFEPASFDVITAWWYFEHVSDPAMTLASIARLLKPTGTFVCGVPNSRSLNAGLFREAWYHLDCPRHLYLWTPSSIRTILERAGFRIPQIRHDRTPWGLLGSLQYLVYGDNLNPATANRLRSNATLSLLLLPATLAVGLLGLGDTMVITAKLTRP